MMVYDNIVNAMRHTEYGISVKDRRYRFVKYKNCFIGSQAVEWLCNGVPDLKRDRKRAVKLGEILRSALNVVLITTQSSSNLPLVERWETPPRMSFQVEILVPSALVTNLKTMYQ